MNNKRSCLVFGLVCLALAVGTLWALVSSMSTGALRAWALASVVLIPGAFLVGWAVGVRDSRALVAGLDRGVNAVMRAAGQTADLRTATAGKMRQAAAQPQTVTALPRLPDPEIVHLRAQNGDVIDL